MRIESCLTARNEPLECASRQENGKPNASQRRSRKELIFTSSDENEYKLTPAGVSLVVLQRQLASKIDSSERFLQQKVKKFFFSEACSETKSISMSQHRRGRSSSQLQDEIVMWRQRETSQFNNESRQIEEEYSEEVESDRTNTSFTLHQKLEENINETSKMRPRQEQARPINPRSELANILIKSTLLLAVVLLLVAPKDLKSFVSGTNAASFARAGVNSLELSPESSLFRPDQPSRLSGPAGARRRKKRHQNQMEPATINLALEQEDALSGDAASHASSYLQPDRLANSLDGKLRIVRLLAPEAVQNGTTNVTIDCMFKFDKKLDERLTIKWFFNDEVEPIYQWIPELNKRVYSDKYERFLDKSYQVSEDVDFMLQAYKWLQANEDAADSQSRQLTTSADERHQQLDGAESGDGPTRRLLANKLSKLASLGGRGHSRQLLESLRSALAMDSADWSRFRALRLIAPTTELSGRFTCSVSSLDGEDLRSTRLVVYEPARSLNFTVSRVANSSQYRLTCRASRAFPRPTLSLFRYRAGPATLEPRARSMQLRAGHLQPAPPRPRLAATQLRQEPIPGTQTQLTISARGGGGATATPAADSTAPSSWTTAEGLGSDPELANDIASAEPTEANLQPPAAYEISAWALVDEASLSSNLVTQFECQLTIEGTNYEQRQSLALQRGWHVNSAALTTTHYTLAVGLLVALASLLCFLLALVKYLMIQRKIHSRSAVGDLTQANGRLSNGSFGVK